MTRVDSVTHILNRNSALRISESYKFILWLPADIVPSTEDRRHELISPASALKHRVMHVASGVCRSAVSWVQLYILGRTISPGNFSLEPKGKGKRVCVGHITLPLACSLQGYWCWVASLHHCTVQQNTNGYAAHVLLWLGPRERSL